MRIKEQSLYWNKDNQDTNDVGAGRPFGPKKDI